MRRLCCVALAVWVVGSACAEPEGKIRAFEVDAVAHSDRDRREVDDARCEREASELLLEAFGKLTVGAMAYGGMSSWERVSAGSIGGLDVDPREPGAPLLPLLRADVTYHDVESDVDAFDVRAEGGYGPFGVHFNLTHYREDEPADDLDLIRVLGLYRMSYGSHVETDIGVGALILEGEDTTGKFAFAFPILVHPSEYWGLEFRPVWAKRISDYDLGLLLTRRYASLKVGYRWVDSPDESLHGPYIGVSFRL